MWKNTRSCPVPLFSPKGFEAALQREGERRMMRWVLVPGVRAAWGLCADRLRDSEGIGDAWDLLLAHDSLAIWVEDIENDRAVGDTVKQHGSRHQTDHNQSRVLEGRGEGGGRSKEERAGGGEG
jgi:hypothetical protein